MNLVVNTDTSAEPTPAGELWAATPLALIVLSANTDLIWLGSAPGHLLPPVYSGYSARPMRAGSAAGTIGSCNRRRAAGE
jgi:hypothetical protein